MINYQLIGRSIFSFLYVEILYTQKIILRFFEERVKQKSPKGFFENLWGKHQDTILGVIPLHLSVFLLLSSRCERHQDTGQPKHL